MDINTRARLSLSAHYEKISSHAPLSKALHDVCQRRSYYRARRIFESKSSYSQIRERQRRSLEMPGLLEECKKLGWEVFEIHPKTRAPIEFSHGALKVGMSAIAHETGKRGWFLVEATSISDDLMHKIAMHKLERAHPALYGHCVLGLGFSKMESCAAFLSSDSGEVYVEMISANPDLFNRLIALYEAITEGNIPESYPIPDCQTCDYETLCFDQKTIPEPSCHTCDYKEGIGPVQCRKWKRPIHDCDALDGCLAHIYNPNLLRFGQYKSKVTLENEEFGHIYEIGGKSILNCSTRATKHSDSLKHGLLFSSRELFIGGVAAITNPQVQALKEQFAGSKIIDFIHGEEKES